MTQEIDIAALRNAAMHNRGMTSYTSLAILDRLENSESMLAQCRDAMPSPALGDKLELAWAAAMACPSEVAEYVKASAAALLDRLEQAEKDAARLDWLASCYPRLMMLPVKVVRQNPTILRDAIDAAMQGEGA